MPAEKLPTIDTETQDLAIQRIVDEPVQFSAWQRTGITLILILVTLIWGSTFLVVQHTIRLVGPFTFLTIRFGIGALALALIYPRRLARLRRYELLSGSLLGVILFAAFALQTTGLQYTSTSMAGFITGLYVPFVPLFSIVLLRQWPKMGAALGIVLSFLGLTLLSVNDHFTLTLGLGELLILGCAVANALHIVSISKFAPRADAINLSIVQIAITALLSLICMPLAREPFVLPPLPVWGSGLFMGVLATAFCLAVMNRVQQFVSSVRATLVYALEPVWTALFGYLAGERLGLLAWFGSACILCAMVIGNLRIPLKKRQGNGAISPAPASANLQKCAPPDPDAADRAGDRGAAGGHA